MNREGIAAEVVFPNTVPPFYPSGIITALAPTSEEEYRYRWEGIKAHNRWLVDFCAQLPGRRAGLAQVFLDDLDDAITEMRWASEAGLSGVLIPGDVGALYDPRYDRLWAASCDLGLPVHRHSIIVTEQTTGFATAAAAVGAHEIMFWVGRAISHLVLGGVFQRFPDLRFVITETGCSWVLPELQKLDFEIRFGQEPGPGTRRVRRSGRGARAVGHRVLPAQLLDRDVDGAARRARTASRDRCRPADVGRRLPPHRGLVPQHPSGAAVALLRCPRGRGADDDLDQRGRRVRARPRLPADHRRRDRADSVEEVATPVSPEELPQESMSATIMAARAAAGAGEA